MEKKTIDITKEYRNKDNSILYFEFVGNIEEENFSEIEANTMLDTLLKDKETNLSFEMIVFFIRTVFKDIRETKLMISTGENNYFREVTFLNGRIQNYLSRQSSKKVPFPSAYQITYNKRGGIHISIKEKNQDIFSENEEYLTLLNIAKKEMKFLKKLQEVKPIELSFIEKEICTIYRLFYKENPNFSNEKNQLKAQAMFAFLIEYGILLDTKNTFFNFFMLNKKSMVSSLELTQIMNLLSPLGEIKEDMNEISLASKTEELIEIIGEEVRKKMQQQEKPIEWFEKLVKINYIKKYCLPNDSDSSKIAEYVNTTEKSVNSKLKLIKKIDKKVNFISEK